MSVFTLNYSCIPPLCRVDNIHYYLNAKLYEHACTFDAPLSTGCKNSNYWQE